jgi:hypothetical protein
MKKANTRSGEAPNEPGSLERRNRGVMAGERIATRRFAGKAIVSPGEKLLRVSTGRDRW